MRTFITSALFVISTIHPNLVEAQKVGTMAEQVPKLIIGITVDQLRTDYLYALQSKLCDGGFKKLLSEGLVYEQVSFDMLNPDATAAIAVLATGSYPFANGISSAMVYNQATLREQSIFYDKKYLGNFTDGNYSPAALVSTTLGDELKTATNGTARIYSVAPEAEAAIIGAGHNANCAFWIDSKTGKWATTTFYKDFPHYIERYNRSDAPNDNIETLHWLPATDMGKEKGLDIMPYRYSADNHFDHQFLQFRQPFYPWFKTSGLVNEAVTKFCKMFLQNGMLGKGAATDMLQVTYYAGTYQHDQAELYAAELQDTYLRLDRSLADLLQSIDAAVGLRNTFIYLTSTGDTNRNTKNVEGLSAGEFNANRCTALLNSYLMSIYGAGNWVVGFDNYQIYLNHKTIDDRQLKLEEIQKSAGEFVAMFTGVKEVVTAHQILHEDYGTRIQKIRNAYNKNFCGDLFVTLQPGWALKVDDITPARSQIRHDVACGPAILFAPHFIKAERIITPIDAACIAPTVARCIRIRAPSACEALPLFFIR